MHAITKRLLTVLLSLCLLLSVGAAVPILASAEDAVISKVLTTLSSTPVALMDPSQITVATSTDGCSIIGAGWFDASGNAVTGTFNSETYRLEIQLGANAGYVFDPEVACYLNNSAITGVVDETRKTVTLTREYTADVWSPTIYKHPGAEVVDEGSWASFVVSGAYVEDYQWALVDPTGTVTVYMKDLKNRFPEMDYAGDGTTKLMLYHIPSELNGWNVVCNFVGAGAGNVNRSQGALITVNPDPSKVVATPEPTPTPAPKESAAPEPTPAAETPPPHVHQFSDPWKYDARSHWHECPDDGAQGDQALHSFTWTEVLAPSDTEYGQDRGVCEICGFTTTRRTGNPVLDSSEADSSKSEGSFFSRLFQKSDSSESEGSFFSGLFKKSDSSESKEHYRPTLLLILLLALIPLDILLIAIHRKRSKKRRRRRR